MLFDWYSLWTLCVCMYMCLCLCVWLCVFECLPNSPRLNLPLCLRLMSFFIRETVQQSKNVARGCASLHLAFKYLFIYLFFFNLIFPADALLSVYPESELSQGGCKALHELDMHLLKSHRSPHTAAIMVQVQA